MERNSLDLTSLRCLNLELPPSCIEFCPAHPDYFIVGTYNLQKDEETAEVEIEINNKNANEQHQKQRQPQSRNGSLLLFGLTGNEIRHIQTVLQPSAIFDLHFHPCPGRHDVLAVVSSTGTLSFFKLVPSGGPSNSLVELAAHRPLGDADDILFLSCCWHPNLSDLIAITTSTHEVHIFQVGDNWNILNPSFEPVLAHTLEAWTVAFSPVPSSIAENTSLPKSAWGEEVTIYSGGDDSKLLHTTCWYKAVDDDEGQLIQVPYASLGIRGHSAGVTAILPLDVTLSDGSRVVTTGSYDDHIRVYAIHEQGRDKAVQKSRLLMEENLGGGVWRMKLVRLGKDDSRSWSASILVSCMHAGCRILQVTGNLDGDCRVQVLAQFEEHKSMNYGSDFQPGSHQDGQTLRCVSTSFYDKLLCLWELPAGLI